MKKTSTVPQISQILLRKQPSSVLIILWPLIVKLLHHRGLVVDHSVICQNKQLVFGQLSCCSFPQCPLASRLPVNEWSRLEAHGSCSGNRNHYQLLKWVKTANMSRKGQAFAWLCIKQPLLHFLWCTICGCVKCFTYVFLWLDKSCLWVLCVRFIPVERIT